MVKKRLNQTIENRKQTKHLKLSCCHLSGFVDMIGRLDERKRRKDFILERSLLYPNPFEKDLSPEERAICRRYDVLMRFHSKDEHEELLRTVISEHRTLKRIQDLKVRHSIGV